MKPLEAYRIVELGLGPVTGLAGMVLADFGAEVIKIDPPAGDRFDAMPASRLWRRGKRTVTADLAKPEDVAKVRELIVATADAVITTLKSAKREAIGLNVSDLTRARPDLVYGVVTGFGERGPYAHLPGYEGVVAAKSGRMLGFEGVADRGGPNYSALLVGTHATSQSLAAAVIAALDCRERTGNGAQFETSMLRGMMPYEMGIMSMEQLQDRGVLERPKVVRDRSRSMPTLNYHPVRTKDGRWLQLGNLLPHLLDNFLGTSGFEKILAQEQFQSEVSTWDRETLELFRDQMLGHMQTRTMDEWMEHYIADGGVVAHPYQSTQDALKDPDATRNGHVVDKDGMVQLGLLANLTETPGEVGDRARACDFERLGSRKVRVPEMRAPVTRPLEGITVVESATIIAAPLGAATLADMGARVIKIEPIGGDPFRSMFHGFGASKCNTGKESICLDLKSDHGQQIAQSLAKKADIWIHNYRMGVPEKLGIGYDQLAALNPGLVYVSANGYGPEGPGAKRPSTHPIPGAAMGGVVWQIGGLPDPGEPMDLPELREMARKLLRANEVNPDPNTSMVVATTAVLGLAARRTSGKGQKIFVDMFGANAYANWDDFFSFPDKPDRLPVDSEGYGLGPLYRLYACSEGWVFLGVISETEKATLAEAMEIELQFDVSDNLERIFRGETADYWEGKLGGLGLGCVRADDLLPQAFFLRNEHCLAENLAVPAMHPEWGQYLRNGPMVEFDQDGTYSGTGGAGGGTLALLEELGYSSVDIQDLLEAGTVRAA
ncbi:MAG: CoA transferase [Pseudomonadales bacterium]|nr:CoA transferase [Pseudomonadales bacterium]